MLKENSEPIFNPDSNDSSFSFGSTVTSLYSSKEISSSQKVKKERDSSQELEEDQLDVEYLNLNNSIFIKKKNTIYKVPFEKIRYIESDQNYCIIHVEDRKFILKISLLQIQDVLADYSFIRVNKRQVINMNLVHSIDLSTNSIKFENNRFNIGRTYKSNLLSRIKILS